MDASIIVLMILFAAVSAIYLYHWVQAISQIKKPHALQFFNWFYLFQPKEFNEIGNAHRKKALLSCCTLVTLLILMAVIGKYVQ